MNYEEVASIVGVLRENPGLAELEVRSGTRTVRLRRAPLTPQRSASRLEGVIPSYVPVSPLSGEEQAASYTGSLSGSDGPLESSSASLHASSAIRQIESSLAGFAPTRVTAEIVGVFRAHRKSDLSVGSSVAEEQSLGQIEAMRLLNDCPSPITGRITAILVQDGEPVEYGQPLFELSALEPAA